MNPLVGYNKPRIIFTVVDLPEPFGPSRPKTSPGRTSKSTLSTALALGRPQKSLNTFVSPRTTTMFSVGGDGLRLAGCGVLSSTAIEVFIREPLRRLGRQLRRRLHPLAGPFVRRLHR